MKLGDALPPRGGGVGAQIEIRARADPVVYVKGQVDLSPHPVLCTRDTDPQTYLNTHRHPETGTHTLPGAHGPLAEVQPLYSHQHTQACTGI